MRVEAYECADAGRYWAELEAELDARRTQQLRADADRAAKRAAEGPLAYLETSIKRTRGADSPADGSASALLGKQRARRARPFFGSRGGLSARHAESPLIPRHAGGDEDDPTPVTAAGQPTIEPDRASSAADGTNAASAPRPPAALSMEMQPLRVLSILAAAEVPSQNAATALKPHATPLSTAVAPEATALPSGVQVAPHPAATALPPGTMVEPKPTMALPPGTPPPEDATDSTTSTNSIPTVTAGHAASTTWATPAVQSDIDLVVGMVSSGVPGLHTAAPPSVSVVLYEALNDVDAQLDARVKCLNQLVRVRREMTTLVRLRAATAPERGGRLPVPLPEGAVYTLDGIAASLFAIRPWEAPSSEQERFEAISRKIHEEETEHVRCVHDMAQMMALDGGDAVA